MEECRRLFKEELELAGMRDADNPDSLSRLYARRQQRLEAMAKRVVAIQACGGMGSGVMLDSQGHIVTNAHVISTNNGVCGRINVVTSNGWQGQARMINGEFEQDIAIIKVEANDDFEGVEIAPEIFLSQDVFAVGHPLGKRHTVTRGVISYLRRIVNRRPYIQTDTSINPGNSGGGLFDELGRLVGLPTFKEVWADNNRNVPVVNIGFAVPGDVVQEFYQRALQRSFSQSCHGDPRAARSAVILS